MLDLLRLSPRRLFPPGGRDLYRQIALLTGMSPDQEVLVASCGHGTTLEYFVTEYGVHGVGVEADPGEVARVEDRARSLSLGGRMQVTRGTAGRLPYRDGIFHVVVGELGLTGETDPEEAIRELVRVVRPGGAVALVQLVWKAPVDEARRSVFEEHLGVRPRMLVEWKRMLREVGVEEVRTEDWTDSDTAFRGRAAKPFPDFAELFSVREKAGILARAWRRWGGAGVGAVLSRERTVHRMLTRERVLGLDLLTGIRALAPVETPTPVESQGRVEGRARVESRGPVESPGEEDPGVRGLPLFGTGGQTP
jgi:SAM-dependent methyltransferase